VVALIGGWLMWQPLRSVQDVNAAEFASSNATAFADARAAASANPLSLDPLLQLAALYQGIHADPSAHSELLQATRLQPDNPEPWVWLAQFEAQTGRPGAAIAAAGRVLALDHTVDPNTNAARATITQAQATLAQRAARARSRRRHRSHPPAARTST
jgi:predicted Zn-dependent protease